MNAIKWAVLAALAVCLVSGCDAGRTEGTDMKEDKSEEILAEFRKVVADWENRKKYSELNPAILKTIPDDMLTQAIVDFVAAAIDEDYKNDKTKVPPLGQGFSAVYFLGQLEMQVNNGGFNQFFFNEGRRSVELAKEGAEFMGMKELAGIIGNALAIADREQAKMAKVKAKGTIDAFMESYEDISFDEADDAFFKPNRDLDKEIVAFIRSKPELFSGKVK